MGVTNILKLPYPELADQANVPVDMQELCVAIEAAVGGLLPQPVYRASDAAQTVTGTDAANEQVFLPTITLRNPHTLLFLLVNIRMTGWVDATPGVFYGSVKSSGQAGFAGAAGVRAENLYRDFSTQATATVAPGATLTAQLKGHKLATANVVTLSLVRCSLTPIGWLKTGAIS